MIAFDTDVLTGLFEGNPAVVARVATIPLLEQAVPVIVVEEILRGRLKSVRQAEAGRGRLSLERAYELLARSVTALQRLPMLPYSAGAESLFREWRRQKIRVATHDLRIAAICVSYPATLVSRNRRDFDQVPGLSVEYWE